MMKDFAVICLLALGLALPVHAVRADNGILEYEIDKFKVTTTAGKTLAVIIVENCDTCSSSRLLVTNATKITHFSLGKIRAQELHRYQKHPAYLKADAKTKELEFIAIFAQEE